MNRRDLLKIFGTGAIIAPVVNGLTDESTRVRLMEPPKVELVEAPKIIEASNITVGEYDAVIYLTPRTGGTAFRWNVTVSTIDMNPLVMRYEDTLFTIRDRSGNPGFKLR